MSHHSELLQHLLSKVRASFDEAELVKTVIMA